MKAKKKARKSTAKKARAVQTAGDRAAATTPTPRVQAWNPTAIARAMERFAELLERAEKVRPIRPEPKKKAKVTKRQALGRSVGDISRTDEVLAILKRRKDKSATLSEIVSTLGHDSYAQKFYGNTCLNLVKRGVCKRKKVDGVFVYTLKAA